MKINCFGHLFCHKNDAKTPDDIVLGLVDKGIKKSLEQNELQKIANLYKNCNSSTKIYLLHNILKVKSKTSDIDKIVKNLNRNNGSTDLRRIFSCLYIAQYSRNDKNSQRVVSELVHGLSEGFPEPVGTPVSSSEGREFDSIDNNIRQDPSKEDSELREGV